MIFSFFCRNIFCCIFFHSSLAGSFSFLCFVFLSLSVCLSRYELCPPAAVAVQDSLEKKRWSAFLFFGGGNRGCLFCFASSFLFSLCLSLSRSLSHCFFKKIGSFSLSLALSKAKDVQVKKERKGEQTNRAALKYTVQRKGGKKSLSFTRASREARAQTSKPAPAGPTAQPSRATSSRQRRRTPRRRRGRLPRRPAPSRGTKG